MTDCFALLGEPRRPWLDPEALKAKFHTLSAGVHPDRVHAASDAARSAANVAFAELNAAYHCLRHPKERLLHLLVLESGEKPADVQRITAGTMDLFQDVGETCRAVDTLLAEREGASPMGRVRLFERGLEWMERLDALREATRTRAAALEAEVRELNTVWAAAPAEGTHERRSALPLQRLAEIHRLYSYLTRWTAQLEERRTRLAL